MITNRCGTKRPPTPPSSGPTWPATSFTGFEPFDKSLVWKEPFAEWFVGGQTNASYNCLDRNLAAGLGDRTAILFEGEPGDTRRLTYAELHREVCKFANVLKDLGIGAGDRVSIYMPMVPELPIAMLACARIGAIHSVIFAGFSAEAIADRNRDAGAKLQITADGSWRRGKLLPLKETVDEALAKSPDRREMRRPPPRRRPDVKVNMQPGRDFWWHELMAKASTDCPAASDGQRSATVHPLHQRFHRQTQGHQAHHGRLQPLRQENVRVGVRPSRRRHFLVHGRLRLGHRPHATSSTARSRPAQRS